MHWALLIPAYLVTFGLYLRIGRHWGRLAGGTRGRLIWVSATLAGMAMLPLVLALVIDADQSSDGRYLWLGAIASTFLIGTLTNFIRLPGPLAVPVNSFVPLDDGDLNQAVSEMSSTLGIRRPAILKFDPPQARQLINAVVFNLTAPTIAVTAATLLRLKPREQRAMLAHELGHLANYSLWAYAWVLVLSATVLVLAATVTSDIIYFVTPLTVYLLMMRLVSRAAEYDCDHRAAKLTGFANTADMLGKIHAAHFIENTGWKSLLAYAVATYPSLVERLAALRNAAPPEDRPLQTWSHTELMQRRWAGRIVLATVLGVLWGAWSTPKETSDGLALIVACLPFLLLMAWSTAINKEHRQRLRRFQLSFFTRSRKIRVGSIWGMIIGTGAMFYVPTPGSSDALIPWGGLLILAVSFVAMLGSILRQGRSLYSRAAALFQQGKFQEVIDLQIRSPKRVQRDAVTRYFIALSWYGLGQKQEAFEDLALLRSSIPSFRQSWFGEAALRLDSGDLQQTREILQEAIAKWPQEIDAYLLLSRVDRLQANLDELKQCTERLVVLSPMSARLPLQRAWIEMGQGNLTAAQEELANAALLSPHDVLVLMTEAELAIRQERIDAGLQALSDAKALFTHDPWLLVSHELCHIHDLVSTSVDAPVGMENRDLPTGEISSHPAPR